MSRRRAVVHRDPSPAGAVCGFPGCGHPATTAVRFTATGGAGWVVVHGCDRHAPAALAGCVTTAKLAGVPVEVVDTKGTDP